MAIMDHFIAISLHKISNKKNEDQFEGNLLYTNIVHFLKSAQFVNRDCADYRFLQISGH